MNEQEGADVDGPSKKKHNSFEEFVIPHWKHTKPFDNIYHLDENYLTYYNLVIKIVTSLTNLHVSQR